MAIKKTLLILLATIVSFNYAEEETKATVDSSSHGVLKRSYGTFEFSGYGDDFSNFDAHKTEALSLGPWISSRPITPSPMEVAQAIAAAKQASANVLIAQQQVQAAKENVINQQRLAAEKETQSAILTQKSEAAAAIQRSEAASAAQSVILAQQRLAAAKNAVAHQQRIASAKESQAAAALQSSAHAAAAEIRKTEQHAARLAALQRTGSAAAAHHVAATKDSTVGSISAGNNHVPNIPFSFHPYSITPWNSIAAAPLGLNGGGGGWPSVHSAQVPSGKSAFNIWG